MPQAPSRQELLNEAKGSDAKYYTSTPKGQEWLNGAPTQQVAAMGTSDVKKSDSQYGSFVAQRTGVYDPATAPNITKPQEGQGHIRQDPNPNTGAPLSQTQADNLNAQGNRYQPNEPIKQFEQNAGMGVGTQPSGQPSSPGGVPSGASPTAQGGVQERRAQKELPQVLLKP